MGTAKEESLVRLSIWPAISYAGLLLAIGLMANTLKNIHIWPAISYAGLLLAIGLMANTRRNNV